MGVDLHRRPDGRGDDRPLGPPRAHPAVRGRKLPDEARPHAAKALGKNTRGLMGILGRFFRVFSLDKTQPTGTCARGRRQTPLDEVPAKRYVSPSSRAWMPPLGVPAGNAAQVSPESVEKRAPCLVTAITAVPRTPKTSPPPESVPPFL